MMQAWRRSDDVNKGAACKLLLVTRVSAKQKQHSAKYLRQQGSIWLFWVLRVDSSCAGRCTQYHALHWL